MDKNRRTKAGRPPASRPRRPSLLSDRRNLADLAMRAYTLERRLWESWLTQQDSNYTPPDRYGREAASFESAPRTSVWERVAALLAERRIGPIDYVARQFDEYISVDRPLFPNKLLGPEAWNRYCESKKTKPGRVLGDLHHQCTRYRQEAVIIAGDLGQVRRPRDIPDEAWLRALYDDQLSQMFVYCLAGKQAEEGGPLSKNFHRIAHRCELTAAIEYVRFRAEYDRGWAWLLPRGFTDRARQLYRDMLRDLF